MKTLTALLVSLCAACSLFTAQPAPAPIDTDWPEVLDCGPSVDDVYSTISTVLLDGTATELEIGDRAIAALHRLKNEHGATTVACLVDLLRREWTRPGASAVPERAAAAGRAESFLERVGTSVRSNAAFEP